MGRVYEKGSQEARYAGRIGGLSRWASDPQGAAEQLAAARRKLEDSFATPQARALHFARLQFKAAQAKKRRGQRSLTTEQAPQIAADD